MIIVNFAHPLPRDQIERIERMTGRKVQRVIEVPVHFDNGADFEAQVQRLVDAVPLSSEEWQTEPVLINPPSLNFIALLLLAELHGRMGYFPAHIRTRPVPDAVPSSYEVAEILDLRAVRDRSRRRRLAGEAGTPEGRRP